MIRTKRHFQMWKWPWSEILEQTSTFPRTPGGKRKKYSIYLSVKLKSYVQWTQLDEIYQKWPFWDLPTTDGVYFILNKYAYPAKFGEFGKILCLVTLTNLHIIFQYKNIELVFFNYASRDPSRPVLLWWNGMECGLIWHSNRPPITW